VPLCPPQIPHNLTWTRTRVAAVGSRRLTAWAMARPYIRSNFKPRLYVSKIKYTTLTQRHNVNPISFNQIYINWWILLHLRRKSSVQRLTIYL
jgi:hypothetical protein